MPQLDAIGTIAALLAAALIGGMLAHRFRQPVILGYLVIGVAVGPHALGLVVDRPVIEAAAAMGVALLMFTLGLEISIAQLRETGRIGWWGGIIQISATVVLGMAAGLFVFRWPMSQAALFGLIISLSSTAVCLKILMERGELNSLPGRIMIAMLIFQDIAVVVMMVIMPLMGSIDKSLPMALAMAAGKAVLFIGLAIALGRWVLPWLMGTVGRVRARELFLLTILVLSLGAALGTQIFGLSMVFGGFVVGLILRETKFSHQALAEITPLRDVFATLFFVSLGMLLDPVFVAANWALILAVLGIIIVIKFLVVFSIVRFFGYSNRIGLLTGGGLLQIGEFGFILAQGGFNRGIISDHFYSMILASAIISMLLTPLSISLAAKLYPRLGWLARDGRPVIKDVAPVPAAATAEVPNRVVIAGYGRVGQNIAKGLRDAGIPYLIIDIDPERVSDARTSGVPRIYGDATNLNVLSHANLARTRALVVTYPDPTAVITTVKLALSINPGVKVLARVHRAKEADILQTLGVKELISPEYEASFRFLKRLLNVMGFKTEDRRRILAIMRQDKEIAEFNPDQSV